MTKDDSFEVLMVRLRLGDGEAARQVFNRFAHRLIAVARERLDSRLRRKVDPEDVLQSVFRSFFVRFSEGQFEVKNWGSLWGLLTLITLRKCATRTAFFRATRRDVYREISPPPDCDDPGIAWDSVARDPSPTEAAMLTELVEQLLRGLDPREQEMITLHLQGYSIPEISEKVRRSERTVHRVLAHVRKRLSRLHDSIPE
jgi:RNA polymerase sigma-70 factor (ECF subfamily)